MAPEMIMNNPECLIENVDGHKLVVKEETLKILSEISNPVVVIAIVGRYRTGKSYLMNRLAGQKSGFALGSTIQSKTKGIWMWCVPHPTKPDYTLVLLDTEGLGDIEKGSSVNDAWIFTLAVLLSSNFIYNSIGTIDCQSMEQLQYVTELTKRIRMKSNKNDENSSEEFKSFFPTFTWCVRDFTLVLKMDGKDVTADEYLTASLKEKKGNTKAIENYNLPRRCILQFFHSHRCFVFDCPAPSRKLKELENMENKDLDEYFKAQADEFCKYMFDKGEVKTLIGGKVVNGKSLSHLIHSYVEAIQKGSVPCLENALQALAEIENKEAVNKALSKYEMEMQEHAKNFPTKTQLDLMNIHKECEKLALEVFSKCSFQDEEQKYQHNLKEKLETKLNSLLKCNEEESKKCLELLQNLSKTIDTDILEGKYCRPGGYQEFLEKKMKLIDEYNRTAGDLLKASEALQLFLSEKRTFERAIMQADKTLTQKEKELAEQEAKIKAAEIEIKWKEENEKKMRELLEIQKKSHEQQIEMLKEKMEQYQENVKRENEWLIERKLEEMRMCDQCMERTRELDRELKKLRETPPCTIS